MSHRASGIIAASTVVFLFALACVAETPDAPTRISGLEDQVYVGYQYTRYDYGLIRTFNGSVTTPLTQLTTQGVNVEYAYRKLNRLDLVSSFRFGAGGLMGEKITTFAGGAGGVLQVRRIQPFGRLLVGYSHLSSNDNIYLAGGPKGGFATMFGAGLDVSINNRWGLRPLYTELQYLPFGPRGSTYWNVGSGVVYRFGHSGGLRRLGEGADELRLH